MGTFYRSLRALGALLVGWLAMMVLAPSPAIANPVLVLNPCVARVTPGDTVASMFAATSRFDCTTHQSSFGPGEYWVRMNGFAIGNSSTEPVKLLIGTYWQHAMTIYVDLADGRIVSQRIDSAHLSRFLKIGAIAELPLPMDQGAVTGVLVRFEQANNMSGIVDSARIASVTDARQSELGAASFYGGFAGLCLTLLVYNFVLWLTLRERFQLVYCGMVVAMMGYASSFSGGLAVVMPGIDANDRLRVSYLTLAAVAIMGLQFAAHFFEVHVVRRRMKRAVTLSTLLLLATSLTFVMAGPKMIHLLDRAYLWSFLPVPILAIAMAVKAWQRKSALLKVYLWAWSLPIAMAFVRILHGAHYLNYRSIFDNCTIIAMASEMLISSLAIAYRIKLIRRERDIAKAEKNFAKRLADVDPLTGLLNRRALLEQLLAEPGEYSLLLVDIDRFKRINDNFGHDVGDHVLRTVSGVLRGWDARISRVARLGGEEFALLVPQGLACVPTETLLEAIRREPMPFAKPVTVSIGVAKGHVADELDWRSLYKQADLALYQAKSSGRARVCYSGELAQAA